MATPNRFTMTKLRALAALVLSAGTLSPATALAEEVIRVGLNRSLMTKGMDAGDFRIVMDHVLNKAKIAGIRFESEVYKSDKEFVTAIREGDSDLFPLLLSEFLPLLAEGTVEPALCVTRAGSAAQRFVILAAGDAEGSALKDFEGASVNVDVFGHQQIPLDWLEVLLFESGLGRARDFFGDVDEVEKASKAIIPVFFGDADLCIVAEPSLETLMELNPQLRRLKVIHRSEPLLVMVLALRASISVEIKNELVTKVSEIHKSIAGRQIMALSKIDRIVAFEMEWLDAGTKLYRRHAAMLDSREAGAAISRVGGGEPGE